MMMRMPLAGGRMYANPLRHRLLYEYTGAPVSPSEVARRLGQPLNLVSYHTRVLAEEGMIELVRTERRRGGTAHVYRAVAASVIEDDGWAALPLTVRRTLVRGVVSAVADTSREAALSGGFDPATSHISRWPVRLDARARTDVARLLRRLLDDLDAIQGACDARAAACRRRVDVAILGFIPAA